MIVALASLTYAIIEGGRVGWLLPRDRRPVRLSLVSFVSLVLYELHRREPLLEMRFFKSAHSRAPARSRSARSPVREAFSS